MNTKYFLTFGQQVSAGQQYDIVNHKFTRDGSFRFNFFHNTCNSARKTVDTIAISNICNTLCNALVTTSDRILRMILYENDISTTVTDFLIPPVTNYVLGVFEIIHEVLFSKMTVLLLN